MKDILIWGLVLLLAFSAPVAGQKGGQTVSDLSVTSTIWDVDTSGLPYDVQSDGVGSYQNSVSGVESILQASANYAWLLSTYDSGFAGSSGRNGFITLGPANQQSATAVLPSIWSSWGTHLEPVRLITHGVGCPFLTIQPGAPTYCPLLIRFGPTFGSGKNTYYYRLDMAPGTTGFNDSETQNVQVSCNAVTSSGNCNDWFVDSIPQGQSGVNRVIAQLTLVRNYSVLTNEGDFYLTFHIHITNP